MQHMGFDHFWPGIGQTTAKHLALHKTFSPQVGSIARMCQNTGQAPILGAGAFLRVRSLVFSFVGFSRTICPCSAISPANTFAHNHSLLCTAFLGKPSFSMSFHAVNQLVKSAAENEAISELDGSGGIAHGRWFDQGDRQLEGSAGGQPGGMRQARGRLAGLLGRYRHGSRGSGQG